MLDPKLLAPERVRPLLRREYDALVRTGALDDVRVELLRGVLVEMSPQSEPHSRITAWLAQVFGSQLRIERYDVRSHSPFAASRDSEPEPDVSVSFRRNVDEHPDGPSTLLLIEVSGSSLTKDRKIKTEIYAEAGVPEYWIVDMKKSVVNVLRGPTPTGYSRARVLAIGDVLRPLRLRNIAIPLADVPWMREGETDEPTRGRGKRKR